MPIVGVCSRGADRCYHGREETVVRVMFDWLGRLP